jgi:hypothetical protein
MQIAHGNEIYERALADPDSLADQPENDDDYYEFESLYSVAGNAWQQVTGKSDRAWYKQREAIQTVQADARDDEELWDFDDEDEMRRRLPRLAKRLSDGGGEDEDEDED